MNPNCRPKQRLTFYYFRYPSYDFAPRRQFPIWSFNAVRDFPILLKDVRSRLTYFGCVKPLTDIVAIDSVTRKFKLR